MTGALKIRLLLFVLAFTFACTAYTINQTFDKKEILYRDAQKLQDRLHKKEKFVQNFFNNPRLFDSLGTLHENAAWAQSLIPELQDKRQIYLNTFQDNRLQFWIGNRILFNSDARVKEGSSFLSWKNGFYEVIKKSKGRFSVIAFIPIKANYPYQNQFLENEFSPDLINTRNIDIASVNDQTTASIRNSDGKYLFSVKLQPQAISYFYSNVELWMWILAIICVFFLVNQLCVWIASRGHILLSIAFLALYLLVFRLVDLENPWFDTHFNLGIFQPKYYASNYFFPSLGDFLLNVLAATWLLGYIYGYRTKIKLNGKIWNRWINYLAFVLMLFSVGFAGYLIDKLFFGLVTNSSFSFNVSNVLNLNWVSWMGLIIFCFLALNFYLVVQIGFALTDTLNLSRKQRLIIFLISLLGILVLRIVSGNFDPVFLLIALILFFSGLAYYRYEDHFQLGIFIFTILIFATGTSIKLSEYELVKEHEARKLLAAKLISGDDPNAVMLFQDIEQQIQGDQTVLQHFDNSLPIPFSLNTHLQRIYFGGYLSRFEFNSYVFDNNDKLIKGDTDASLKNYKDFVLSKAVKVSDYFYRVSNTFGFQHYFALLPIRYNGQPPATLVVELKSKDLALPTSSPTLLVDGKIKDNVPLKKYSYAYYNNGRLASQYGKFVYNLLMGNFKVKVRDYVFVKKTEIGGDEYSHLFFKSSSRKLIVISKEVDGIVTRLASVSFLFLVLLFFSAAIFILKWTWFSFLNYDIRLRNFRWNYLVTSNRILYKTRIQVSMVAAVVFTLLVTAFITYLNIKEQYREQQEGEIVEKINKIASGLYKIVLNDEPFAADVDLELAFNNFAELNGADLNLFDLRGNLVLSSQPKIYESGLIAPKISSMAYLYLTMLQKSEFISAEKIGNSQFISAYIPLRNSQNVPLGYLGLPYFTNEKDYENRLGEFINALVNVYALVFVSIGFFAIFVANRITSPLTLIQKNLSEIQIGRRNEPIVWKRNDEIGNLIKEYNNMISALEESTQKLARSERETAWREMAKQVAHEIKNPLTPLKLGVQLLEKSWKEKDPNFDKKFEKFSKSFIEQIESLARIASEFSNFAKMPETVFKKVYLPEIMRQSIDLYRHADHTIFNFQNTIPEGKFALGDKDQLLNCFNNLIKNSVEARMEGRELKIAVRLYNTGKNAFIEIHDNGTGITEELRAQIFTPNFTTKSSGTGLGLAFVKQALEYMGGNISYRTDMGIGTTFYINIPLES